MRGFRIKIVAWTIEVYRQEKNRVKPVLGSVCLRLDKHHFLGQPIGRIGFFRITVPKVFFKRNRSEFWVCADGSQGDKFFHTELTPIFHEF